MMDISAIAPSVAAVVVARMSAAISGIAAVDCPGCRCAHPGYSLRNQIRQAYPPPPKPPYVLRVRLAEGAVMRRRECGDGCGASACASHARAGDASGRSRLHYEGLPSMARRGGTERRYAA